MTMWAKTPDGQAHAFLSREAYDDGSHALCGDVIEQSQTLRRGELATSKRCDTCAKMVKDGRVVAR